MLSPQDKQHLRFIYNRMVEIHGENPNVDYMLKFDTIIGDKPIIPSKSSIKQPDFVWEELTGVLYDITLKEIKPLEPIDTSSSTHVFEAIYNLNGSTIRELSAISDDPDSPDYKPNLYVKCRIVE